MILLLGLTLTTARQAEARPDADRVLFAVFPTQESIVLDDHPAASWAEGPAKVLADPGDVADWYLIGRGTIAASRLPKSARRWLGQRFTLFAIEGGRCEATLNGFRVLSIGNPTPALERQYAALSRLPSGDPVAERRIAAKLWASGSKFLVADTTSDCQNNDWAYPASAGVEAVVSLDELPPDSALHTQALAAFRALPAYKAIARRYAASRPAGRASPSWDSTPDDPALVAKAVLPSATIIMVDAAVGYGAFPRVHGFEAGLRALWELRGDPLHPALTLRVQPAARPPSAPATLDWVVQVRDDPRLLFIYGSEEKRGVVRESGKGNLVEERAAAFDK